MTNLSYTEHTLIKEHGQVSRLMDRTLTLEIFVAHLPLEYSFNHSVLSSAVNDVDDDLIL